MCLGPQVYPPTQKGQSYKRGLKILMAFQAVIVLLNFIAAREFIMQALIGLFFIFIIYMIQHQCSYQCIMMFIFIGVFFAVSFLIYFLTPVQNGVDVSTYDSFDKFIYAVSIISFVYYVFVMIFCFYPYREFKAIAFNENPALRNYFAGGYAGDGPGDNDDGGDDKNKRVQNIDVNANYGNIEYDRNRRNNDHGTFEVFKGQGVRIG